MELHDLLNKIETECRLDTGHTLPERMSVYIPQPEPEFFEPDIEPEPGTDMEPNIFSIRNENHALTISSKADFEEYQQKILQLKELEKWVHTNQDIKDIDSIVSFMQTMIQNIYTRKQPSYQPDKDNAQVLAEYVGKNILDKYIKSIIVTILREMQSDQKKGRDSHALLSLLACINRYLKNLGIYTITAMEGMPYEAVADYYDLLNGGLLQNTDPVISSISHPAYFIDYIDKNGSQMQYFINGTCTGN